MMHKQNKKNILYNVLLCEFSVRSVSCNTSSLYNIL